MDNSCLSLPFPSVGGREVVTRFDGGDLTSDAGLLILRQADKKVGLVDALSACVADRRQASKIEHTVRDVVAARLFAIAAGYEDANDLDRLRIDPALKVACERLPSEANLASQPTISRLENAVRPRDLLRMSVAMAERVIAQMPKKTRRVVLDIDATEDACHGQQELEGFNAFYDEHCYLPLHLYVTGSDKRQRLLASVLRPGRASWRLGLFGLLRRAIVLLRERFPGVKIILRADAGFGHGEMIGFCEESGIDYALGLRSNRRVATLSTPVQMWAALKHGREGDGCREYAEFGYKAGSWPHARRVVVKAEVTRHELNPRYLVTSLRWRPEKVYLFYCQRGDRENRIKELKLDMASGRTSCHRFWANQFRLLLHTAACVLMQVLQEAADGTEWARAQAGTFRLRVLKVAARVVESCRKLWFHLPSSCPSQDIWGHLHRRLSIEVT
jgi:hypothetical protein